MTPKEFGVIAIVLVFITFFTMLGDMGLGPAIIQNKELKQKEISDIYIFSIIMAVILSIFFYFFSFFIVYFYDNTVYFKICHLLSISIFFNTVNIVPTAILLKNKQFKIIGINTFIVNSLVGIITIILAIKGFSYYSLVIDSIVESILIFSINLHFSKLKIIFNYDNSTINKIRRYSLFQFSFNFINYFSRNLDNILIGKYLGVNELGYYNKAYSLMLYPVQNLTFVITPVLQPVLSEYQNDKEAIYKYYIKIVKILALMGIFISMFCFFSSKEIILILFGNQWIQSINSFKILSLTIAIQMVASSSGSIFQATGHVKELFISGLLSAFVTVTSILIGLKFNKIEFVAYGILIAFSINFFQTYYILIKKVFHKNLFNFFMELRNTIIILILMVITYNLVVLNTPNIFLSLIFKFSIGLSSYLFGLLITKEYKLLKDIIKN